MLGIGTGIINAAGAGAGGGGAVTFDPCADLPGGRNRVIIDLWDPTCLIYDAVAGLSNGGPPTTTNVAVAPSKDAFDTWDTWENLVAGITEECTDPTLDTPSEWTTSDVTISGGTATFTGVATATLTQNTAISSLTVGVDEWYLIALEFSAYTSGRVEVQVGTTTALNVTPAVGTNYIWMHIRAGGANQMIIKSDSASNQLIGTISDVSIKRVPGNHQFSQFSSNNLFTEEDADGISYLSGVSDGMLSEADITVPTYLGWMVMAQGNDVTQQDYDGIFAIDAADHLNFGNTPGRSGAWNFEVALHVPNATNVWKSGEDNGDDLAVWEGNLDWDDTLAYQIYKNNSSVASGTAPSAINLGGSLVRYRMMANDSGGLELNGNIYGFYIWESDGTQPAGMFDWLNTNTGEKL